jgi:uncharacterized membrane protein YfcA
MPLVYLVIGLLAGVLSGLFGIGGGLVIVPALVVLAKMSMKTATGTSLGALLLPVGLLAAMTYWRAGNLEVRASLLIAAGLLVGAWFGARLHFEVGSQAVQRMFAGLLVVMAVRLWVTA